MDEESKRTHVEKFHRLVVVEIEVVDVLVSRLAKVKADLALHWTFNDWFPTFGPYGNQRIETLGIESTEAASTMVLRGSGLGRFWGDDTPKALFQRLCEVVENANGSPCKVKLTFRHLSLGPAYSLGD